MTELAAVILAGGMSTRMGTNKALLNYKGKSFLQTIIDELKPLKIPIYLSGNHDWLAEYDLPIIRDEEAEQGPVVALASCFRSINAINTLVISCDVPQLKTEDIRRLIDAHKADIDVTMFRAEEKDLPLIAIYSKSAYPHFLTAFKNGERRLFSVIDKLQSAFINVTGPLKNINTPKDLASIQ